LSTCFFVFAHTGTSFWGVGGFGAASYFSSFSSYEMILLTSSSFLRSKFGSSSQPAISLYFHSILAHSFAALISSN